MGYHYIALVDVSRTQAKPALSDSQIEYLKVRGLRLVPLAGPVTLFISPETPVLALAGGLVIGHLFSNEGCPITADALRAHAGQDLASYLLKHCWGEYLLLRTQAKTAPALDVMREPSGGVPCFHHVVAGIGFITSDVSLAHGLGLHSGEVDWDFIAHALAYPYVNTARTGLIDMRELLPGSALALRGTAASLSEVWSPWAFVGHAHRHRDIQAAAAEVRASVETVVRAWAETDRTVLVELSGGLDSSIVAMSLQDVEAQVACCTMVTPVPGADERRYARQVADALSLPLHDEVLGFDNARFDFVPPVHTARPRMSVLQYVTHEAAVAAARAHGNVSFFSGGGGDTVFCFASGAAPAADAFRERGVSAGLAAIRDLSVLHECTHWTAGRLTLKKLLRGARMPPVKPTTSLLDPLVSLPALDSHSWFEAPAGTLPGDQERIAGLVGTQVYREGAPRGSAHWLRLPLLSQPVMEACLKAPSWMWIAGGRNRSVARLAFADRLPHDVLERRSKGTFINYLGAIYQRRKLTMRDYLLDGHLRARGFLDGAAIECLVGATLPPRDTSFSRLFDLCMIENWLRHRP